MLIPATHLGTGTEGVVALSTLSAGQHPPLWPLAYTTTALANVLQNKINWLLYLRT
ncbi:hypothetical protein DPMN_176309 [Dreissena polymorpha]|uniref:Uncharacterized protein n=1 Tax=Dreissena polymorpha TaxID=45954 RepID=A0A9D4EAQ8_DREPO|nr:hypothetical protein DPMN_176309 [Dreissena polymorpha]